MNAAKTEDNTSPQEALTLTLSQGKRGRALFLAAWLVGVAVLTLRLNVGHIQIRRLVARAEEPSRAVRLECARVAEAVGCRGGVRLLCSADISSPFICGLRRPALILPARMCDDGYRSDVPAILAHEMTHVRSHDLRWNVGLQLASILLWFHPLAWRIRHAHLSACELVCDAASAHFIGNVTDYCRTLARVAIDAHRPLAATTLAMARPATITRRLAALRKRVFHLPLRRRSVVAFGVVALLGIGLLGALRVALAEPPAAELTTPATRADATLAEKQQTSEGSGGAKRRKDAWRLSVVDGNGKPIPGASVKIEGPNGTVVADSITLDAPPASVQAKGVRALATAASDDESRDKLAAAAAEQETVVTGQVTLRGGEAAGSAHVAVAALWLQPTRGGALSPRGDVLAEGTTDDTGHYRLTLKGVSSKTHSNAHVIARQDGAAIAWKRVNLDARNVEASLELPPEEPISGRFVVGQGEPAGGVNLWIRSVVKQSKNTDTYMEGVGYQDFTLPPAAWVPTVTSDGQGRFTIHGVAAGHGVLFHAEGDDRFAPQDIALNTGMPEQRGERDATYRPTVKNVASGEVAVLSLAPAQVFEGVVTYADTGQPAPHARLTIWASQQESTGSMISVAGVANGQGEYRISPMPGIRFGVTAYPPDGAAYLARTTRDSDEIRWEVGRRVKHVDMTLPRGVLVRGKVLESGTDAPVAGASIQYVPERANNPNVTDDILTGWQAIQLSNEQGEFTIAVLPGPGHLLAHGPKATYVLKEIADRELSDGEPGGRRNYVHAAEKIDPEKDGKPIDVTLHLQPGITVTGRIVDQNGQPADEVLVVSRLWYFPLSLHWRGQMPPTLGGRFELSGLEEGKEYPVYFLDANRRLGATVTIRAGDEPTVVLEPCGTATARYLDAEGKPRVGFDAYLHMIVTPGAGEYDWDAAKRGELAADADFISNIDRTNYWPGPKTDDQGRVTFPALVPGATYRIPTKGNGTPVFKEFTVASGQQLDLGDIKTL